MFYRIEVRISRINSFGKILLLKKIINNASSVRYCITTHKHKSGPTGIRKNLTIGLKYRMTIAMCIETIES